MIFQLNFKHLERRADVFKKWCLFCRNHNKVCLMEQFYRKFRAKEIGLAKFDAG